MDVQGEGRVQRLGQDLLDRSTHLDLEDLDAQGKVLKRQTQHLGQRVVLHLRLVPELGEEVERQPFLHSTCTSTTLSCVTLGDPGLDKLGDLPFLVESGSEGAEIVAVSLRATSELQPTEEDAPHLTVFTGVNDADTVRDSDSRLSDVGRDDDLAHPGRGSVEDGTLTLGGDTVSTTTNDGQRAAPIVDSRRIGTHLECRGKTMKSAVPKAGCSCSMSLRRRISFLQTLRSKKSDPNPKLVERSDGTHNPGMKIRTDAEY